MARRNDAADEIQGRNTEMPKVEPENSRAANQETVAVSFTVEDFLDGRCTVEDLAADAIREVESLEHERIERGKERLEQLVIRLEMELEREMEMEVEEEDEYEPGPPVVVLALAAEPPATPTPGGEPRPRD